MVTPQTVLKELVRRFAESGQITSHGRLIVLNEDEWHVLLEATKPPAKPWTWPEDIDFREAASRNDLPDEE